ncbi:MAG: S8 family peptidase [Bryobacterales bacterium]|nr:S8 family peptidase [Bryobacterales bacterium]
MYFDFEIPAGSEAAAELLENRVKHIELAAVRQESETSPAVATVFVPDSAADHFLKKVEVYRTENTKKGKPKNEALIARIQDVALAGVRSLFTDDPAMLPAAGQQIWWEAWIRQGHAASFEAVAHRLEIRIQRLRLRFPDREVRLVFGNEITIARLFVNSDAIAELRRAKDTPSLFVRWSNVEQAAWATDLVGRLAGPEREDISVCVLDTGVTQAHPLLAPALDPDDVHTYDPTWPGGDNRGHGTNMAGTALYGDLMPLMADHGPVPLTHRLESVKILPDQGENEPRLYGAITAESIARAEVQAPARRRAVCLAVTSDLGTNRGRPSSWSSAVDQLCIGDATTRRLVLISAGNIRDGLLKAHYPARNETESIENPGQAWNAITVGACTEKATLVDPTYAGWEPIAPAGDLSPTSRTSLAWEEKWPIKPDIVVEGGNWAALGDQCDCPDDLGILTTYRDPTTRHFDIFRDTSAATAMAGNLAGRILAAVPERWPETIRALIVHSAEWTPVMRQQFEAAPSKQQKRVVLRKYGYGVPSYARAIFSALNDLTLIAEDEFQPLWKDLECPGF